MERKFESDSMLWDGGDIPTCNFCGLDFDGCDGELFDTPFSGELCCKSESCMDELAEQCLESKVEEVDE